MIESCYNFIKKTIKINYCIMMGRHIVMIFVVNVAKLESYQSYQSLTISCFFSLDSWLQGVSMKFGSQIERLHWVVLWGRWKSLDSVFGYGKVILSHRIEPTSIQEFNFHFWQ